MGGSMTSRLQQRRQFNTAGLEADVMRFMAIIAFCLIAMTAMVKDEQITTTKTETESESEPEPEQEVENQVSERTILEIPHTPNMTTSTSESRAPVSDQKTTDNPESLVLKFDSDKTFIHLIAAGKLVLFGKLEDSYIAMDEEFHITTSNPTGELYEVMATSIPSKIRHVFENAEAVSLYLVKLPEESSHALKGFIQDQDTPAFGTLVIRQNGSIVHER
jgi:hypothetical protein